MAGQSRARKVPSAERIDQETRALDLRRAGVTYDLIGRELGINRGVAYRYVNDALARTLQEPADALREVVLDRLDRALRAYWPKVLQGDVQAGAMFLRIEERRAKLLGLDAPVRAQVEVTDAVSAEIERLAQQLGMTKPAPQKDVDAP